ncbi:MAG: type II toxin-antitoxin system VapC family toxin [Rhodocyclaceae bacterium]|nr:type II toxin-antitoxin system VapC family toxin [Rhodocyclaceae bacterium]
MILLDTHVWLRWVAPDTGQLPESVRHAIDEAPRLAVSAVSCWELAYLVRVGKIVPSLPLAAWFEAALTESSVEALPLTCEIARFAAELPLIHRDPADRFTIATALWYRCPLVSLDGEFRRYPELVTLLIPA